MPAPTPSCPDLRSQYEGTDRAAGRGRLLPDAVDAPIDSSRPQAASHDRPLTLRLILEFAFSDVD